MHEQLMGNAQLHQRLRFSYGRWGFNRRMLKTACPVVWEGLRAQSRRPDPIKKGREAIFSHLLTHYRFYSFILVRLL